MLLKLVLSIMACVALTMAAPSTPSTTITKRAYNEAREAHIEFLADLMKRTEEAPPETNHTELYEAALEARGHRTHGVPNNWILAPRCYPQPDPNRCQVGNAVWWHDDYAVISVWRADCKIAGYNPHVNFGMNSGWYSMFSELPHAIVMKMIDWPYAPDVWYAGRRSGWYMSDAGWGGSCYTDEGHAKNGRYCMTPFNCAP